MRISAGGRSRGSRDAPWPWGRGPRPRGCIPPPAAAGALVALAIGACILPGAVDAEPASQEIAVPEVKVTATPLSSVRSPRAARERTGGGQQTTPAPAPAAPTVSAANASAPAAAANPDVLTPQDFSHTVSTSVPDALLRRVPSVFINETSGNPFQPDVQYRGFQASPVLGTPQGLAIYQNGVRINEAFGDTVNWDLIPETAINRLDVVSNNPAFGLNAIGGAISIEMKNGFTYEGRETEVRGGSFWRRAAMTQVGVRQDNVAAYFEADALNDNGWRQRSPSQLRRTFGDVGWRGDQSEFHLNFTGASNLFGATATTPIELLNRNWSAVYTTPQTYRNQLAFLEATGSHQLSDNVTLKGNAYVRNFRQSHVDGNSSEIVTCSDPGGFLCFGNNTTPLFGVGIGPVPDFLNGAAPGTIDRTATVATALGGAGQATVEGRLAGHDNRFVIGTSLDHGNVNFNASSELGTIGPDLFVTGTGVIIAQPNGEVAPVALKTLNTYTGLYLTDTFDVTSRLSVTGGGRFNVAQITLEDQLGTALNGDHQFSRFNPVIGLTYKLDPSVTAYAGYSEANRAPTPAELACADPARPCLLDNFLVADPPLKQVVAHTTEAGLRGKLDLATPRGQIAWSFGVFRTDSDDDIINVASPLTGRGFFQNAGTTRRQGIEAAASYRSDRWNVFATYSLVDATFRDPLLLSSPNNPFAVNGLITVTPGDRIPSIPLHRFKTGVEFAMRDNWKIGADLIAAGGQYLRGDESNLNPMLPGYWLVNLHTSYQISKQVEAFGLVQNLFDRRYYTFGTFFDTTQIPFLGLTDPRTLAPGAPFALYAGLRGRF
jgi:iron complex outermembrane receptor protein